MWANRLERALFVAAAVCLGWYGGVKVAASREQTLMARELASSSSGARPPTGGPSADAGGSYVVPTDSVIGRIDVPRLKLTAMAREGVDDRTLEIAVGHVPGTALPGDAGNSAFAAHRDTFFRSLRGIHDGDEVVVTTPRGRYRYLVTTTRIVRAEDVSVLDPTPHPALTLVTCYPFYYVGSAPYRFIVRAELETHQKGRILHP
jgi:sortase A